MNWNYYIQLLIFVSVSSAEKFEKELLTLTNVIVDTYFNQFNCLTYITENIKSAPSLRVNKLILNIDLTDDFIRDEILVESYELNCANYVIRTRVENQEKIIRRLIHAYRNATNFRYNKQRYLYLPYDEEDNNTDVLNMTDMFYAPNLIMVTSFKLNEHYNFSIVGHNYFNGHKYDVLGIKNEIVDTWIFDKGFHRNADLYPDRIKNLNGKKLTLGVIHYPLYTIVIKENNKTVFDGLETRIAATFVGLNNGTWDAIDHPIALWGTLFDNGTGDGILGSVISHKADMGYAAIYQWHCDVLECSYPYVYAGVTCMVPRPQLVPGWLTVVLPFTPKTWISLISVYIISSFFVLFVSVVLQHMKDEKNQKILHVLLFDSFFITLRLQLEQIPKEAKEKSPLATYLKWLTVYYFFVANCWSGGVASILTVPRHEDPINEVVDLIERSPTMQWGGNSIDWLISIKQTSEPMLRQIVDQFVLADDEALKKRIKTRDFGFFMERLPNGHYGMNDYIDEKSLEYLKIMEGNIYTANVVIVMPRGSPYQERLDKMIIWMFDTGLIQKLEVQVSLERVNNRLQNLIKSSNEKPAEEITHLQIRHLQGPLIIYLGGITISAVMFVIELCFHKMQSRLFKNNQKNCWIK